MFYIMLHYITLSCIVLCYYLDEYQQMFTNFKTVSQ